MSDTYEYAIFSEENGVRTHIKVVGDRLTGEKTSSLVSDDTDVGKKALRRAAKKKLEDMFIPSAKAGVDIQLDVVQIDVVQEQIA